MPGDAADEQAVGDRSCDRSVSVDEPDGKHNLAAVGKTVDGPRRKLCVLGGAKGFFAESSARRHLFENATRSQTTVTERLAHKIC